LLLKCLRRLAVFAGLEKRSCIGEGLNNS